MQLAIYPHMTKKKRPVRNDWNTLLINRISCLTIGKPKIGTIKKNSVLSIMLIGNGNANSLAKVVPEKYALFVDRIRLSPNLPPDMAWICSYKKKNTITEKRISKENLTVLLPARIIFRRITNIHPTPKYTIVPNLI